jgi:hypothetical protein
MDKQTTKILKPKSFYFHFNKPSTQRAGSVKISVHYNDTCHIVDNVVCKVPTLGKINTRQPRFVMRGKCTKFAIKQGIAYIS